MKAWMVAIACLALAACSSDSSVFGDAYDRCATEGASLPGIEVSDDGASISLDGEPGDGAAGASIADIACILVALDMPGSLISKMNDTTAADGLQGAQWLEFTARWTYDADGLDIVIELTD